VLAVISTAKGRFNEEFGLKGGHTEIKEQDGRSRERAERLKISLESIEKYVSFIARRF
jgi:hypothetical protein